MNQNFPPNLSFNKKNFMLKKIYFVFFFCLYSSIASAKFISEIGIDVKRYYSRFYEVCSDGYWFTGGGISLSKVIRKDKLYIISGINYLPSAVCIVDQKVKYLQIPIDLRCYFLKRIIFAEASIDFRWLTNHDSIEYNYFLKKYGGGFGIALGVQQPINKNLFLNMKAFSNLGISPQQRNAGMTNFGFEGEVGYCFK
jgi:hypothetical protein